VKVCTPRDRLTIDAICQTLGDFCTWNLVHLETVWQLTPSLRHCEAPVRESMYT